MAKLPSENSRLERRLGRLWLAAVIVVALRAAEHALYPVLVSGGGLDLGFAAYRVGSVLPFLAAWTAAYYALGRRLLPVMAARWVVNGGSALAPGPGPGRMSGRRRRRPPWRVFVFTSLLVSDDGAVGDERGA